MTELQDLRKQYFEKRQFIKQLEILVEIKSNELWKLERDIEEMPSDEDPNIRFGILEKIKSRLEFGNNHRLKYLKNPMYGPKKQRNDYVIRDGSDYIASFKESELESVKKLGIEPLYG